jgi:hypothetical protein
LRLYALDLATAVAARDSTSSMAEAVAEWSEAEQGFPYYASTASRISSTGATSTSPSPLTLRRLEILLTGRSLFHGDTYAKRTPPTSPSPLTLRRLEILLTGRALFHSDTYATRTLFHAGDARSGHAGGYRESVQQT